MKMSHPERVKYRALIGLALVAGVAMLGLWLKRPHPAPVSRPSSELVRLDGRLMLRTATNQPFTGWLTEHYTDGSPKSRSRIANGWLEGVSEGWHTNGVLQVQEHFVAGAAEGPVTKWHANGVKLSEGLARAGKLEGVFRRWHDNGVLAEEVTLQNGQPHGVSRSWFPSGSLKAEVTLENGTVVQQTFWKDGDRPPSTVAASTLSR